MAAADGGAPGSRSGIRCGAALTELPDDAPVVLATGGFGASRELLREHVTAEAEHVFLRAAPGGTGDGLRLGLAAGGETSGDLDQVYARLMPAPPARIAPADLVRLSQLYADARRGDERERRAPPRPHLVGDRRRPVGGPPAARASVPPRRERASSASTCASAASAR